MLIPLPEDVGMFSLILVIPAGSLQSSSRSEPGLPSEGRTGTLGRAKDRNPGARGVGTSGRMYLIPGFLTVAGLVTIGGASLEPLIHQW